MSASLHALSNDDIGSGSFGRLCFVDGRNVCEPLDALAFHPRYEVVRVEPHNGGYDRGAGLQHCFALCFKIWWSSVASFPRNLWSPIAEKTPHRIFGNDVPFGRRIGNPQIQLKATVSACANFRRPVSDCNWLHEECATTAQAPGIGNCNGQRSRTGAGHRCHQNWHTQIERFTERSGADEGMML